MTCDPANLTVVMRFAWPELKMVNFRVAYERSVVRVRLAAHELSYTRLLTLVHDSIGTSVVLKFVDEDADVVLLTCDEDLLDVLHLQRGTSCVDLLGERGSTVSMSILGVDSSVIIFDINEQEFPGSDSDSLDPVPMVEHTDIQCNNCSTTPLIGIRYKCTVCADFDLCQACEPSNIHPDTHSMLKMRTPQAMPIKTVTHTGVRCDSCSATPIIGVRYKCDICPDFNMCSLCEARDTHTSTHPLLKLKAPLAVPEKLFAEFIEDVTIPDGSNLSPGDTVAKVWRLRNTGTTPWPAGLKIRPVGGSPNYFIPSSLDVSLPSVAAGASIQISVDVLVPPTPSRYVSYFKLESHTGDVFGPRFWIDFSVLDSPQKEGVINPQVQDGVERFSNELLELKFMGVPVDTPRNVCLLDRFNGDTNAVVNWYVEKNSKKN